MKLSGQVYRFFYLVTFSALAASFVYFAGLAFQKYR